VNLLLRTGGRTGDLALMADRGMIPAEVRTAVVAGSLDSAEASAAALLGPFIGEVEQQSALGAFLNRAIRLPTLNMPILVGAVVRSCRVL